MHDGSAIVPMGLDVAAGPDPRPAAHPVDLHLGVRLRELRARARLSQAALAERIGVTQQLIHWYETAESRIAASTLFDLAGGLDCTVADFYAGLEHSIAGRPDSTQTLFAAVLDTRSGADLVDGFPRVSDRVQEEIAGLVQTLADGRP